MSKLPEHIAIEKSLPAAVLDWHERFGQRTIIIDSRHVLAIMTLLRDSFGYDMLCDLTAVDYHPRRPRYEVVYHLLNMTNHDRLRVKVQLEDGRLHIASLTPLYPIADWLEREVWDMFGVKFDGHPSLKRILLYEEFEGHPLRKDYPKTKRQPLIGPQN